MRKNNKQSARRISLQIFPALLVFILVLGACAPAATEAPAAPQQPAATSEPAMESPTEEPMMELPATIKIGASIPLTGRYAGGAAQVNNGYLLAVEDINNAGGVDINGTKIPLELTILDDEADPTKVVQNLETLASTDGVVAYLGGFGSDLHTAAAGIAEKNQIPYCGVAFALKKPHEQGFKYLFSPFPKSPALAASTFEMFDSFADKPTNIAIFAEKTDWGAELSGLWTDEANKRNIPITTYEYAPDAQDFSEIILAAKDQGADAILALPIPPAGPAIAKQMKELGLNAKVYVFIRAPDVPTFGEALGTDANGFFLMPGWNNQLKFDGVAEMADRYTKKFNAPAAATTGPAYACVQILADAISRAGSVDPTAIRDAMAATDLQNTVIGPVTFNEDGTGNVVNVINQWQDGKQILVWPPDQAVADPIYPVAPWGSR